MGGTGCPAGPDRHGPLCQPGSRTTTRWEGRGIRGGARRGADRPAGRRARRRRAGVPAGVGGGPLNVAVGVARLGGAVAVRRLARRRRARRPDPRLPGRRRGRTGRGGHRAGAHHAGGDHLRRGRARLPLLRRTPVVRAARRRRPGRRAGRPAPACSTAARSCCSARRCWPPPAGPGRSRPACGSSTPTSGPGCWPAPATLAGLREVVGGVRRHGATWSSSAAADAALL